MIERSERVGSWWHLALAMCIVTASSIMVPTTAEATTKLERFTQETSARLKKFSRAAAYYAKGIASYYGRAFQGRLTASGERFNMHELTAAHKTLPLNSLVRVTNLENGLSVVVRITDRGPYVGNRMIDLSYAAAKKLKMVAQGTARVEIAKLGEGERFLADRLRRHDEKPAAKKPAQAYYVSAGDYPSPESGQRVLAMLDGLSQVPGKLQSWTQPGDNSHYSLIIGPLASREEAETWVDKLTAKGIPEARVLSGADTSLADNDSSASRYSVLDLVPQN